jgi:hypothetical protein
MKKKKSNYFRIQTNFVRAQFFISFKNLQFGAGKNNFAIWAGRTMIKIFILFYFIFNIILNKNMCRIQIKEGIRSGVANPNWSLGRNLENLPKIWTFWDAFLGHIMKIENYR